MLSNCFKYFLISLLFYCLNLSESNDNNNNNKPQVKIDGDELKGSIVGRKFYKSNVEYMAFRGIPYAKPPIKEWRFRDPQKPDKFEGILDATDNGYDCNSLTAYNASEDCLNLNVYTKQLKPAHLLPVVVVIHPGGLYVGSGASFFMNPSYMMTQDLVLVTFNYRLGSLGFLNLGTAEIPGNAGFKDQVYALRWIEKYIQHFGGNPKDITLMGYSAGALSVQLHLMSAMSKDLFHKAIIMSGALPPQIYVADQQKYLAVRLAKRLNCKAFEEIEEEIPYGVAEKFSNYDDVSNEKILECLNQYSSSEIAGKLRTMFDFGRDNPIFLWLPVIEKDFKQEQQERFLSENVTVAHKNLLIGYTNGELCMSAKDILLSEPQRNKFSSEFDILAPRLFMYERYPQRDMITEKIKEKYLNGSTNFSLKDYDALCDLFSDALIRFGAHKLAELMSQNNGIVYFYEFSFVTDQDRIDKEFPEKQDRCEHMSDFQYLFNWPERKHDAEREKKMVEMYTSFIYDFVKNGKLSHNKAKPYPQAFAAINENIEYKEGRNFQKYEFWQQLFPKYFNYNLN